MKIVTVLIFSLLAEFSSIVRWLSCHCIETFGFWPRGGTNLLFSSVSEGNNRILLYTGISFFKSRPQRRKHTLSWFLSSLHPFSIVWLQWASFLILCSNFKETEIHVWHLMKQTHLKFHRVFCLSRCFRLFFVFWDLVLFWFFVLTPFSDICFGKD